MSTFLGKEIKSSYSSWTIITESIVKINKTQLEQIVSITVHTSDYDSKQLYAKIELKEGFVTFTIDSKCTKNLSEGMQLNPLSILIYKLTNGEKTIERLYGESI